MHSYSYSKGRWTAIEDPLQGKHMGAYGFPEPNTFYRLGVCAIAYSACDPKLRSVQRKPSEFSYDFYAQIRIDIGMSEAHYDVWISSLSDFLQFQKEFSPLDNDLRSLVRKASLVLNRIDESGLQIYPYGGTFSVEIEKE